MTQQIHNAKQWSLSITEITQVDTHWHSDGGIADGLKYERNRVERQVARKDAPLARVVQTEEEEREQKEAMTRLETRKKMSVDMSWSSRIFRYSTHSQLVW